MCKDSEEAVESAAHAAGQQNRVDSLWQSGSRFLLLSHSVGRLNTASCSWYVWNSGQLKQTVAGNKQLHSSLTVHPSPTHSFFTSFRPSVDKITARYNIKNKQRREARGSGCSWSSKLHSPQPGSDKLLSRCSSSFTLVLPLSLPDEHQWSRDQRDLLLLLTPTSLA